MAQVSNQTVIDLFKKVYGGLNDLRPDTDKIDKLIPFETSPRKIVIQLAGGVGNCQRPLRAQTPQGERVALASSETVQETSVLEFEIRLLDEGLEGLVREWLDYGQYRGLGQWRNSGKGRFLWEEVE